MSGFSLPTAPLLLALNHLLQQADWARQRLQPFAGHKARLTLDTPVAALLAPLVLPFSITEQGLFALVKVDGEAEPTFEVELFLPADTAMRALTGGLEEAMKDAHISGSAGFAEALGFVLRNLRWDAEADAARVMGDIAAHRLVSSGEKALAWQKESATRLVANVQEYLLIEQPLLVSQAALDEFHADVIELSRDLDALEKRLKRS